MSGDKGIRRSEDVVPMYSEVVVMDEDGAVLRGEGIKNSAEKWSDSRSLLPNTNVVIESSSTWYWAYRILSSGHRVFSSNLIKTKAIASAKVKTDTIDTIMLADLLRGGYVTK